MRNRIARAWPRTGLWQDRGFLNFWAAQTISALGSRISRTALPIVAILTINATPAEIGILSALSVAPGIVVGLLLGGWVDRSEKRAILISADLIRAALLLTVPMTASLQVLTIEQLYLVAAGVGAFTVLFQIADNAYLPELIGHDQLIEGNTKLEVADAAAEIGGPSLAGVLIDLLTAPITILFDAISFLASAAFLSGIRQKEKAPDRAPERATLASDFAIGLRSGFGDPLIRPLFLAEANRALFGGFFLTLYMIFTIQTLGLSPTTVGLLIGLGGVGAILGTMMTHRAAALLGLGPALIAFLSLGQLAGVLIPLASGPGWLAFGLLAVHQLLGDAAIVAYTIYATSLRQTVIPLGHIGRTTSTLHVMNGLLLPIGALLSGWLAAQVDVRTAVWIGVIGGLLSPLVVALSPIPKLQTMPVVD
jgi:predicted MFS family arabinose efflux permease